MATRARTRLGFILLVLLAITLFVARNSNLMSSSVINNPSINNPSGHSPKNIILFYDDYPPEANTLSQITPEIAAPLVAHLDANGNPTDWMFDTIIFYSTGLYHDQKPTKAYVDSWISYLFQGKQVANLDATVTTLRDELHQQTYRMKVFIALPVSVDAVQTGAVVSNIDSVVARWNALNASSLKLVGFYWGFTENPIDLGSFSPNYQQLLQAVARHIHDLGFKFLIVPYLNSYQHDLLHALGFDLAIMQPNYAWSSKDDLSVFQQVENELEAGYIDGVEFELPNAMTDRGDLKCCNGDWIANMQTYIEQAYRFHWEIRPAVYYYGSSISFMYYFDLYRSAYDSLYQYILTTSNSMLVSQGPLTFEVYLTSSNPTIQAIGLRARHNDAQFSKGPLS